ncbi:hypothetical protein IWW38_004198, partial [Coemansia aciculifera]
MRVADRISNNGSAADTKVLNPRRVLTRAPSSDLAFLHAAQEVTQKLSQQPTTGHSGGSVARVLETRVSGGSAHRVRVDCVECDVPPRCVSASVGGWAVEHKSGGHVSIVRNGMARAAGIRGTLDVRCSWWIGEQVVGVVAVAPVADVLWIYVVDGDGDARRIEVPVPARDKIGPVVAQGSFVVYADAVTGTLGFWDLDVSGGGRTSIGVVRSGYIEGGPNDKVVDLRWVSDGVGLAATQTGAFWFDVRKEAGHQRNEAPSGWLQPGRRLVAGLSASKLLSWYWQEAVVAVAGTSFPPRSAMLCLPSPTGMAFYDIGEPTKAEAGRQHTRKFES